MANCKNKYYLPINKKDTLKIHSDSPAHTGLLKYSIDFECKINTPVCASATGVVVWLREDSRVGGPDKKYWFKGNRIVIKHKNNEYSAYEHLKYKGVLVKLGENIIKGQLIGYSGNTGYSFGPHLHFEVFNKPSTDQSDGETLRVRFEQ